MTPQQVVDSIMPLLMGEENMPFGNVASGSRESGLHLKIIQTRAKNADLLIHGNIFQ